MKLVRFIYRNDVLHGLLEGERVRVITLDGRGAVQRTDTVVPLHETRLLAPCTPTKIVAVGLNYRAHAAELGMPLPNEPLLFIKPSTAVIGHGDAIVYPAMARRVDYEAELGVVIGAVCKNILPEEAGRFVLGYTCCNDVTARDLQKKDGQFTRSKGFDTFAPVGPCIETELDPADLAITATVNGRMVQQGTTRDMIFSVPQLVSFISRIMTLLPGDIIATGTPPGIGPLQIGDKIAIAVDGIGTLCNMVVAPS